VHAGRAPGLQVAAQRTNVLFDLLLSALLQAFGAAAAQRIAVSLSVLVFVWGAFAFVRKVSGTRPTYLLVAIVMLAYGWAFHMGLFNFYISQGLCFWGMALAWDFRPLRMAAAVPLFALAYVAHSMPLAWAMGVLAYKFLAERVPANRRMQLFAASLIAVVLLRFALAAAVRTLWFGDQIESMTAVDQLAVFGDRYWICAMLLLLVWAASLAAIARQSGIRAFFETVPVQICALTALGIGVIPNWVALPGYNHALVFIAQRTSLALGICVCAVAGRVPPRRFQKYLLAAAAVLFFVFLYRDERALNGLEDRMARLVLQLPPGQRVIANINATDVRTNPVTHLIDRICIGRCYSYGNYEPSSAVFRVRVAGQSPLIVPTDRDASQIEAGVYVVKPRDVPLYQVRLNPDGELAIVSLPAGAETGISAWDGLSGW